MVHRLPMEGFLILHSIIPPIVSFDAIASLIAFSISSEPPAEISFAHISV